MSISIFHTDALDPDRLRRQAASGAWADFSAQYLNVLHHFHLTTYFSLAEHERDALTRFLEAFFSIFVNSQFAVPKQLETTFVQSAITLSNVVAMSHFRTTDGYLALIHDRPADAVKVMTLASGRNRVRVDRRMLFDADAALASIWYQQYIAISMSGLMRAEVCRNLREHLAYRDERMTITEDVHQAYFGSTYADDAEDRNVKALLNRVVRKAVGVIRRSPQPNPRKVAVISDCWKPRHSVYRNYYGYVKSLKPAFHLTFFHVLTEPNALELGLFDEVRRLPFQNGRLHLESLEGNDFAAVYFPDVGMNLSSTWIANHRIAPVQFCSPGHSVSTWGAEIDYFITGALVERASEPERNYSERLVLLPGFGVIHNAPDYQRQFKPKATSEIIVNCPWTAPKLNVRFVRVLREILSRVRRPVRFRIFGAVTNLQNGYLPFMDDLRECLESDCVEVVPNLPYAEYMALMEEGDLSIDSFHFGGCNTVGDSLYLAKPTVVWEGEFWYNRIGPAMVRHVGLGEWIARDAESYAEKVIRLIEDDDCRRRVSEQLRDNPRVQELFSAQYADSFREAAEFLIANHQELLRIGERGAIRIE